MRRRADRELEHSRQGVQPRRTVLIVAYFFPPFGGGGTPRTAKFVKYLPDLGYRCIVVTARPGRHVVKDSSLLDEIPSSTSVIRATAAPLWVLKWGVQRILRRFAISTRITEYIGWPDEFAGWIPAATWHALRVVWRERVDVLYTTSSPTSAHVVGWIVRQSTGIPWVADFRDPWTLNPWREQLARPLRALNERAERAVVSAASEVVVAAESVKVLSQPRRGGRITVVRNGVDPPDVGVAGWRMTGSLFRLSYVGSLYGDYNCAPIFLALRQLIEHGMLDQRRIEVRVVGQVGVPPDTFARVPVTLTGYVDHPAAISEMVSASALLFHIPASSTAPSGKIYEYLAAGRPILCVASKENLASQLVTDLDAGVCVEPHDIDGVANAILTFFRQWENAELVLSPSVREKVLRRFSRRSLTGDLAQIFDRAIAAGMQQHGHRQRKWRTNRPAG